jgi:hypothetical protein
MLRPDNLLVEDSSTNDRQLYDWKESQMLPRFFYPGHASNLILLCSLCHNGYDDNYPAWTILPQNLKFFIDFEEQDYNERVAAARRGVSKERSLPNVRSFLFFFGPIF